MPRADFRYAERLRVRWAEIDAQQIVFNGHYLMYLDTAIAGYWRALAMPYAETMHALGGDLYVRKATLEYHASARYDEQLEVGIRLDRIGSSSMRFVAGVFRDDTLLVSGELVYVFADPATQSSRPVPEPLRAALQAWEAGEPSVAVTIGPWSALGTEVARLRDESIAPGLQAPTAPVDAPQDATALQALARNRFGRPVATGALHEAPDGRGRIASLAVLPLLRGAGIGSAVLERLLEAARERGFREVAIRSPMTAWRFFARHGFRMQGEPVGDADRTAVDAVRQL